MDHDVIWIPPVGRCQTSSIGIVRTNSVHCVSEAAATRPWDPVSTSASGATGSSDATTMGQEQKVSHNYSSCKTTDDLGDVVLDQIASLPDLKSWRRHSDGSKSSIMGPLAVHAKPLGAILKTTPVRLLAPASC